MAQVAMRAASLVVCSENGGMVASNPFPAPKIQRPSSSFAAPRREAGARVTAERAPKQKSPANRPGSPILPVPSQPEGRQGGILDMT